MIVLLYCLYAVCLLLVGGTSVSPEFFFKWGSLLLVYMACRVVVPPTVFLCLVAAGGIYEAVLGVLQIVGAVETASPLFGITGSFFNPGPYAGFLAMSVLCALSLGRICLRQKIKGCRAIFAVCVLFTAFMAAVMIVANSRASILALCGGFLWYFLSKYKDTVNWKHLLIGGVAMLMVVAALYNTRKSSDYGACLGSIIVGWIVFACFSYPAEVFVLKGVFAGVLGLSGRRYGEKIAGMKYVFLGIISVVVVYLGIEAHKWKGEKMEMIKVMAMIDRKVIGKEALADYVKDNLDKLRREQYVYDRCVLGLCALSGDADEVEGYLDYVSVSCLNYCAIGDLYRRDAQFDVAEDYYLRAHNMIPTMITPVSALFRMYRNKGDSTKAAVYARKVLELPVKIENTKTIKARREAEKYAEPK